MIPFQTVCPEVAQREVRSVMASAPPQLAGEEFAFIEWYCDEMHCDCRRVILEVIARSRPDKPVAHIAFGWERRAFYERCSAAPRDIARTMARETTEGALDPMNAQSPLALMILDLFRQMIAVDPDYPARLKRHYDLFRKTLKAKGG
jgi:hypothetical protein